jgi:hypothetical protein
VTFLFLFKCYLTPPTRTYLYKKYNIFEINSYTFIIYIFTKVAINLNEVNKISVQNEG